MDPFQYIGSPIRVLFGANQLQQLPRELARLNVSSPLLISGPRQAGQTETLKTLLNGKVAGVFNGATMHTPVHVTEKALAYANDKQADSIVSIGGGSAIGLGKALSFGMGLPHICIPTTYSGSEMTPVLGETAEGKKTTRRDDRILPKTVIYDVDLTMRLPAEMSACSGVNAMAHAVEALYAKDTNPIISLLALEGVRALANALPVVVKTPSNQEARSKALYGAWLCGSCLSSVSMGLHHKLCHTLGGSFDLPHAETHTIMLPHALSYNAPAAPEVMARLAEALPESEGDAVRGLNMLLGRLGVKRGLRELDMREEDVDRAAEIAVGAQYANPRMVEKVLIREVIRRAWAGEDARADL